MSRSCSRHFLSPAVFICVAFMLAGVRAHATAPNGQGGSLVAGVPLYFEPMDGTNAFQSEFVARGSDCTVALRPTEALILVRNSDDERYSLDKLDAIDVGQKIRTVRLQLCGANPNARIAGANPISGRANYLVGNPADWITGVPLFGNVRVNEIYPGIDLVYHADASGLLEYDFVVQPGANPEVIAFNAAGFDGVRVDTNGALALKIGGEEILQHKPVIYQDTEGGRKEIDGGYCVVNKSEVRFRLGSYDRRLSLVIDPVLTFSTYLGAGRKDAAWAVAQDATGLYVAGETLSKKFPATPGAFDTKYGGGKGNFGDGFVAKYDTVSNSLIYLTFLGGRFNDSVLAVATDGSSAFATGFTDSPDFPITNSIRPELTGRTNNAFRIHLVDAFVTKLTPDGSGVEFSVLLGGDKRDAGYGIAVDPGGIYVAGYTESTNFFPIVNAVKPNAIGDGDVFVTKLDLNGGTNGGYSTYLGGDHRDQAEAIAVTNGIAYITGRTSSPGFPLDSVSTNVPELNLNGSSGASDAFFVELDPNGALLYFTFLGGGQDDSGQAISAVDASGSALITGFTQSKNFPTNVLTTNVTGVLSSADSFDVHVFVSLINPTTNATTQFGGGASDQGTGVGRDSSGNIYVTGFTSSKKFFPTNGMFIDMRVSTNAEGKKIEEKSPYNIFVAVLSSDLTSFVSTNSVMLGGTRNDRAHGILVDSSNPSNVTAYIVGSSTSRNFPTVNPVQPKLGGAPESEASDAIVSRLQWP